MKTIEEVHEMWEVDCVIDRTNISSELLNIPILHCKYLRILNEHKLASIKTKSNYEKMKNIKTEYYLGNLDEETLNNYGWEQFDLKLGSKGNIDRYISADDDLNKILQKKAYHDQLIYSIESILNEIKNRNWELRSYIEWEKFLAGA